MIFWYEKYVFLLVTFPRCQCAPCGIFCRLHTFTVSARQSEKHFNLSNIFFSAIVVTSRNVQGLCSYTLLFFARFLQLREIDANNHFMDFYGNFYGKNYLPLIKVRIFFTLISHCQCCGPRLHFCCMMRVSY